MTDRPILFSAPMVLALLEGRKTQTRRVHKVPDNLAHLAGSVAPRFAVGDRLWVRETITLGYMSNFLTGQPTKAVVAYYMADHDDVVDEVGFNLAPWWKNLEHDLPSIYMPRWASRITLHITEVRVQRLHDISEADCIAEGVIQGKDRWEVPGIAVMDSARSAYFTLLDYLNGQGFSAANPWVVATSFTVEKINIGSARP